MRALAPLIQIRLDGLHPQALGKILRSFAGTCGVLRMLEQRAQRPATVPVLQEMRCGTQTP